jgi:phosphoribosylformylglycinamidine cyclo-ligase
MTRMDYSSAGVDIEAAAKAKEKIRQLARKTFTTGTLGDIGSFGGLFRLDTSKYRDPVLVASTDGVGTKLKVAFATGRHDTVGYDLVAHCINDILVQGARPLFFLDYLAMGKLVPEVAEAVVSGISRACEEFGVSLIGGETAEMPGFYAAGEYDLAGTIVGVVERDAVIDGSTVEPGDVLVGLGSTGLHTNGYSLARRIFFEKEALGPDSVVAELDASVAELLLAPHQCYLPLIAPLLEKRMVKAMAHITGGGLTDNLPRVLPRGTSARVRLGSWRIPPLFDYLRKKGSVSEAEMLRTFNVGIGMVVMVAKEHEKEAVELLSSHGEKPLVIGDIVSGEGRVIYEGSL